MYKLFYKSLLVTASCVVLVLIGFAMAPIMEPATEKEKQVLAGGRIIELNEDNWQLMLEGEWMVGIFATWCQSCKDMAPAWESFAHMAAAVAVQVAKIEVNQAPALSGRFLVTHVPKIYHVKDGEFRQYRGDVYDCALLNYVTKGMWKSIQPLSPWLKPNALHMSFLAYFAKVSHALKEMKMRLQADYGMPEFVVYMLVASVIVIIGISLGSLVMYLVDLVSGPKSMEKKYRKEAKEENQGVPALIEQVEDLPIEEIENDENDNKEQRDNQIQDLGNETYEQQEGQAVKQQKNENEYKAGEDGGEEEGKEQPSNSSSQEDTGVDSESEKIKLVGVTSCEKLEKAKKKLKGKSRYQIV